MGIRGLTSYVNSLQNLVWKDYDLSDKKLVIDGNGLCYHLYASNDCRYGGQYSELKEEVVRYFTKLTTNGVHPYVIFDGILDVSDKKLSTVLARRVEKIRRACDMSKGKRHMVLPLLSKSTVLKTLNEINVPYAVADYEADSEIASVANELGAPVMGNDSDFFIFNINHGYIPFGNYQTCSSNMVVSRFKCDRLAKHLNISTSMLPMLASLVGNDYVSDEALALLNNVASLKRSFRRATSEIQNVAAYLSGTKGNKEVLAAICCELPQNRGNQFKKAVSLSLEEYEIRPTPLCGYFTHSSLGSNLRTHNGLTLPEWIISIHRSGIFGDCISCLVHRRVLLKIQVENSVEPSANISTTPIRHHLFKLLMEYDNDRLYSVKAMGETIVKEYDRERLSLVKRKTDLHELSTGAQISKIPIMTRNAATSYVCKVLSCDITHVESLPLEWQLVATALRFWLINAKPKVTEEHFVALMVYLVEDKRTSTQHRPDVEPFHVFAQWQHVVYWVNNMNLLFSNVFPSLDPAKLYNGLDTYRVYRTILRSGIQSVEKTLINVELYQKLRGAVLSDLPKERVFREPEVDKDVRKRKGRKKATQSDVILKGNKFELLRISSSDTDED